MDRALREKGRGKKGHNRNHPAKWPSVWNHNRNHHHRTCNFCMEMSELVLTRTPRSMNVYGWYQPSRGLSLKMGRIAFGYARSNGDQEITARRN